MSQENLIDAYRMMFTIRQFEERVQQLTVDGEIAGSVHLCLGQEAIPVGTNMALRSQDRVLSTYRGHGWALSSGTHPTTLFAEITQRAGGTNGGRAGSAMLSDPDNGFFGENAIVGAGIPIGAGLALASQFMNEDRVVVSSIGDGAMNQGATTEGMIFAAAKNLPIIFICENNGWAEMTATSATTRNQDLADRARGLGIESHVLDGNCPSVVAETVSKAIQKCASGNGPIFLECKTARLGGHYNRDIQHYRSGSDREKAAEVDPLPRLKQRLISLGTDLSLLKQLESEVVEMVDRSSSDALSMPVPDTTTVLDHLYGEQMPIAEAPRELPENSENMTYQRAVNTALAIELENRPDVVIYGEDVGNAGGIFGITRGLQKKFGERRVFDTPIAESAILGSAVGAAMAGMRPVVEIMWADFLFVALDQVINQAANVRYINRSRLTAPLTIRTQQGITPGACAQHAQSIEAILSHIPGIKVGLASTPQDAFAMTRAAIADDDPVVVIEARSLYQVSGNVNVGGDVQAASGARVHREGSDVAIVSWGEMVGRADEAAAILHEEGIQASVLDLRWLRPLDDETLSRIVLNAGGRVIVVHEATMTAGFGAEIASLITERHFNELHGPVVRLAASDTRIPSSPNLQEAIVPGTDQIVDAARKLVKLSSSQ